VFVVSSGRGGACRSHGRSNCSRGSSRSSIASVVVRIGLCLQRLLNKNGAKSPAKKKDAPGKSPVKLKKDKRARSDSGEKRQIKHDRHSKRDKPDMHEKHDRHGKNGKSGRHDKHDRHDRRRRREDIRTIISMGTGGGRGGV
jgi:hypothetical protein